jgi:predicted 3-demethylubiquinone-9 3-methyltransferase (glyoxalase superfamily)
MQKIIPHLWFDTQAEEAVAFYTSVFKGGKKGAVTHYTDEGFEIHHMKAGTVLTAEFEIEGLRMIALNGGPIFTFTPAISFTLVCPTKADVDEVWNKLSAGGEALMPLDAYPFSERYGWIKDKFGLTWQVIYQPDAKRELFPSLLYVGPVAGKAEEAMKLYTQTFKNSKIGAINRYGAGQAPDREGSVMYADFMLEGQKFSAMDSAHPAHAFNFNEAVSLLVQCDDQKEIDRLWSALSAVPESEQCGWIKDRFGVSWQIAPKGMAEMLNASDKAAANRAMAAMLSMKKIDIAALKKAFDGK